MENYSSRHDRKVVQDSKKLGDLLKNPNKYAAMIVGVILLLAAVIAGIITLVVKLIKRNRKKKK